MDYVDFCTKRGGKYSLFEGRSLAHAHDKSHESLVCSSIMWIGQLHSTGIQPFSTLDRSCVGGISVAAFVSGGYLPPGVRGTTNNGIVHIADWCDSLLLAV